MSDHPLLSPKLAELSDGDSFEGFYAVRESSLQTAVNGKNYIRMTIADASASIQGNVWDANRDLFLLCPTDSIIKIQAVAESYKGKSQVRINRMRPAHASEVDMDRFLPKTKQDIPKMKDEILALVDSLKDNDYQAMAKAFFHDNSLMERFSKAPAARDVHHAYIGGLLEHTLNIARMADSFSQKAKINRDLLILGALLHDIGKIDEMAAKFSIEYTDSGKLLGHLYLGAEMVSQRASKITNFPAEKMRLIQHLILSHHGRFEYGSPVLPKTPEAFALHHLDNLDAKVETANRILDDIQDPEKQWSEYSRPLETALFREHGREAKNKNV